MLGNRIFYNRGVGINKIITVMPIIFAGILNMIFTKTKFYNKHKRPIDNKRSINNKRILGDNKTWIGFGSMVIISGLTHVIWGYILRLLNLESKSDYYVKHDNRITYNLIVGLSNGFIYMVSELPNSFIKRRLDIDSGKRANGIKGVLFYIIDQIDSIVGIAYLIKKLSKINVRETLKYIGIGGFVHAIINLILFKIKVRENI